MFIVNTTFIPGHDLELLGLVRGGTIQSRHLGHDIGSGLKTLVGGELKAYTEMMNRSREIAIERMIAEAQQLGADAIINVRFCTSSIMDGAAEVMAYGTAVRYKD